MLSVKNLSKSFGRHCALDNVSFEVAAGEIFGVVGESGSGKTTLARLVLDLIPKDAGEIIFEENPKKFRKKIQMVFQDPQNSLNPKMRVGQILSEPLLIHDIVPRNCLKNKLKELMEKVRLGESFLTRFPYALSGGERQRVNLARALAVAPEMIILDEPISSLDVTTQAEIIQLLKKIKEEQKLTYIFISHDLNLVGNFCSRVAVMEKGKIVEILTDFSKVQHPYTKKLLAARLD